MEKMNLFLKIYELKGIIKSMVELASYDDEFNNPLIGEVEQKMREVIEIVDEKQLSM